MQLLYVMPRKCCPLLCGYLLRCWFDSLSRSRPFTLKVGETVLIIGIGGVGSVAVQGCQGRWCMRIRG